MNDLKQIGYALERQALALEGQAERLAKQCDYAAEFPAADAECLRDAIALLTANPPPPIDMVLHCPRCSEQHIDGPETFDITKVPGGGTWQNPPHRSHLCSHCGYVWRPADVPTNGVYAVKTKGKDDSPILRRAS